ncbi:hypothetical protein [Cellulomonas sp. URHB0016]
MAGFSDATLGTSTSVGRYFGIVSVFPSVLLVTWVFLLGATGAWSTSPDPGNVPQAVAQLGVVGALGLVATSLALAAALHPLQFTIVQLMEGYWGPSRTARALRLRRSLAHARLLNRAEELQFAGGDLGLSVGLGGDDENEVMEEILNAEGLAHGAERAQRALRSRIAIETGQTLRAGYPIEVADIMPTRLGNTLRRYESAAGAGYGLPLLDQSAALVMVARPEHVSYINDQRSSLDLAVRISAVGLMATAVTVVAMLPHGVWLGLALVPYGAAWLSYRGAVTVAAEYGKGLVALTDLNRFRLYEELRLGAPSTAAAERSANAAWRSVAGSDPARGDAADIVYRHPGGPGAGMRPRRDASRSPLSIRRVPQRDASSS